MPGSPIGNLAAARVAIGAGSWLAPALAGRAFGLDVEGNPQAPYIARLFGVRDAALGYGLLTSEGAERRRWLMIGIACDLADTLAGVQTLRDGTLPRLSGVLVTATALAAAGMGVAALQGA
ncbi:MAG TPA: hypothetical protein VHX88_16040 [Solirubrobacteraceae bacterium]|nr:hypothetical protein [Solirubrobacteraceae bacterium]